jgi:hypothetical protein
MTYQLRQWRSRQRRYTGAATALVATLATVAASMAATTSPASADSTSSVTGTPVTTIPVWSTRLSAIKAEAARLIADRITSLNKEIGLINAKTDLGSDGTALVAEMQADISGLQTLGAKIAGDTTVRQARADTWLIFTQFRVYLFMLPVASDVVRSDGLTNVDVAKVNSAVTWLQGQENPSNQAVIAPLVANMQSQVQIDTGALSGLSAQLLAYTPANWNANHGLFNGADADLKVAVRAIGTAARDAAEAYRYLEHHHVPPTTTTSTTTTPEPTTTSTTAPATTSTTSGNLGAIQAWAARLISDRLAALQAEIKKVQGEAYLGGDATTLVNGMQSDITGLEALGTKIAADTSAAQAQADAALIFSDYRVYDLMLRVATDVSAVDWTDNVKLSAIGKEITYVEGQENSNTQAFLAPLVTNMQQQVSTATSATSGLSAQLLGYTAAEWDTNPHLLGGAEANLYLAQRAVNSAQEDYAKAEQYVRSSHKSHRH